VFAALGQDLPGPPAQSAGDQAGGGGRGPFANMTPEQRAEMRQRMEQMTPEQREQMRQRRAERESGRDGAPRPGPGGPVRIWVLTDGRLAPVPVQLGISDGVNTEIAATDLKEGAQVVTGLVAQSAAASQTTGSPLLPFGGRGFGNRGGGGGGGQRGGAAPPAGGRR
jgi:hypothetical protein